MQSKTEKAVEGPAAALLRTEKAGGGRAVAPRKKETEASQVGAQSSVETVASRVGACQVVGLTLAGLGASLAVAAMAAIPAGASLAGAEASENRGQTGVAWTCSPCTGSSRSEVR